MKRNARSSRVRPLPESGIALVVTILILLLMSALGLFFFCQVINQWRLATAVESQLYSLVLAENGVEYARTLLPQVRVDRLLQGPDGRHSGVSAPEWRSPMPFTQARKADPAEWVPDRDDGLPSYGNRLLLPRGYRAVGGGYFFLRFSNNPEEGPDHDEDGVVLVRSVGIVPSRLRNPFLAGYGNDVALVEAVLRQERAFLVPSALTLFGDEGTFQWQGDFFQIVATDQSAVSVVSWSQAGLKEQVLESLPPEHWTQVQGAGDSPSVQDATLSYQCSKIYQALYQPQFWLHFYQQLLNFREFDGEGISYLPEGGELNGRFTGIVVAQGDLIVSGSARITGLLLHLGGGSLALQDQCEIIGGVWMSNLEPVGGILSPSSLALSMSGSAVIRYDADQIERAVARLPPTQIGWRIMFPEMQQ